MLPLQGLDAGLLVGADDVDPLLGQLSGPFVEVADGRRLLAEGRRVKRVGIEPVATAMGLEVGLSLKNAPHFVEQWSRRSVVS
jgi:hypothetical protein